MGEYSKVTSFLLVGVESTFNTPVAATKDIGIVSDYNWDFNNNLFEIPSSLGNRELSAIEAGDFEGTISYNGVLNSGAIFELFFNRCTDTASTADYKHTFIDDDGTETLKSELSSFTAIGSFDLTAADITISGGGCTVNKIDLSIEVGSPINVSGEIYVAGVDTGTTAGTKVTTTTKPLIYTQGSISIGAESSESAIGKVQSFSISFENGYTRVKGGLGARTASGHVPGTLKMSGSMTIIFDTKDELEIFLGGSAETQTVLTNQGLIVDFNNGVNLGSGRRDFYARIWGVKLGTTGVTIPEEGPVEASFDWQGTTLKDLYMTDTVTTYF